MVLDSQLKLVVCVCVCCVCVCVVCVVCVCASMSVCCVKHATLHGVENSTNCAMVHELDSMMTDIRLVF